MARELIFNIAGKDYGAAPVKLERKKIYGWTNIVATDKDGEVCSSAYLSPDDALVIPSGGLKQAVVDDEGRWVEKGELTPFSEDGAEPRENRLFGIVTVNVAENLLERAERQILRICRRTAHLKGSIVELLAESDEKRRCLNLGTFLC